MRKLVAISVSVAAIFSLAACGGTQSDSQKVAALGDKAVSAMHDGNVAKLAGLMDPSCSAEFLGSAAMAKAFGIDLGEFMKSTASNIQGNVKADRITISGDKATTPNGATFAVRVNGIWYVDCSDVDAPSTTA